MSFIILFGLILVILYPFDSLSQRILFFFVYTAIGFIGIFIAGVFHEKRRIKNSRLYSFQYVAVKWEDVNHEMLKFNNEESVALPMRHYCSLVTSLIHNRYFHESRSHKLLNLIKYFIQNF